MAHVDVTVKGGTKLAPTLAKLAKSLESGSVRVGFLEGATYPERDPGADSLLKGLDKLNSTGPHQPGGKPARLRKYRAARKIKTAAFVGPGAPAQILSVAQVAFWNNYGTTRAPPRPFFSNAVKENSPAWGSDMAKIAKAVGLNTGRILKLMGERIKDQIVEAIVKWPADNAPLTVAIKGFNKGLVHQGIMQRSVDYEVKE